MRKEMTEAERRLWNQIRAHRLMGLGFRRQVPIAGYIADFACPQHKLVVEVDGTWHAHPGAAFHDRQRTSKLGETGWTVVRFWNHEVMKELDDVCEHIVGLVREVSPHAFQE
jgi:very-short-patch-repair endonuclease